jgi:hypothetical protein
MKVKVVDQERELQFELLASTLISALRNQAAHEYRVSPESLMLFFRGNTLADHMTLQEAGIKAESIIRAHYRVATLRTICIIMPDGTVRRVFLSETETAQSLMARLGFAETDDSIVELRRNDEAITSDCLLCDLDLQDMEGLRMVVFAKGGGVFMQSSSAAC